MTHPHRRLFWRIYLFGIFLLLAVLVSVGAAMHLLNPGEPLWQQAPQRIAESAAAELERSPDDHARLQENFDQWQYLGDVSLAVYTLDGHRIAASGEVAQPALPRSEASALKKLDVIHRGIVKTIAIPLRSTGGPAAYLLISHNQGPSLSRLAFIVFIALGASAIVLYPLARSIARPLERIASTADALGYGQLDARSGIERSDEIGDLARAFDRMVGRLEKRVLGEKELLANVSHELRTPLARMRLALALCEESGDVLSIQKRLRGVESDIVELDRLIEDVLTLTRLDLAAQGDVGFVLHREERPLEGIIDDAVSRFEAAHPDAKLERLPFTGAPKSIESDPVLLRRVFDNILENAARYAIPEEDPGSTPVTLRVDYGPEKITVCIRDHGPGVSPEDRARLLEPFYRVNRSRSDGQGIGLGLTLCRRVIEAHGGEISLDDAAPGLSVTLHLPA